MKRSLILATALVFSLLAPRVGRADLFLTLSSTAPDLTNLMEGQTVHFDVSISGLGDSGNPSDLAFFTADVGFSEALFGTPTSLTAGAIIPDPSPGSFVAVTDPGVAGSIYLGATPITGNGILFSFDVLAAALGSGTVAILDADGFDSAGNEYSGTSPGGIDIASSLSYDIRAQAVPEPSTFVLLSIGVVAGLIYGRRRVRFP